MSRNRRGNGDKIACVNLRFVRGIAAASGLLLIVAKWFALGTLWTLPLAIVGFACSVIHIADTQRARGESDTVTVLNLHG